MTFHRVGRVVGPQGGTPGLSGILFHPGRLAWGLQPNPNADQWFTKLYWSCSPHPLPQFPTALRRLPHQHPDRWAAWES